MSERRPTPAPEREVFPPVVKLTARDIAHLERGLEARLDAYWREEDDGGPEPVMVSAGYVELWLDGTVIAYGQVVHRLDGGL